MSGAATGGCIVTADDFGVSAGVNRAVRELHDCGVLTSAALVATGGAFEDAVRVAEATPSLDVGLHFVLARGSPCAPADRLHGLLTPEGKFPTRRGLITRVLRRRVRGAVIEAELDAQLGALQRAGITPSFINGDQHVHALPL